MSTINQQPSNPSLCLNGIALEQVSGFHYRPIRLLDTDSKMSKILLAAAPDDTDVIIKIGCIEQPSRAELNRQAIHNEAFWLHHFQGMPGIAHVQPLPQTGSTANGNSPKKKQGLLRGWRTKNGKSGLPASDNSPEDLIQTLAIPGEPDYLALDYLSGGTLTHFVDRSRLRVEMALRIAHYIARTLAMVHHGHCVHRDLKPENVLFPAVPTSQNDIDRLGPTIIDFGVAAQVGAKKMVSGSRLWMAPELQDAYERHGIRVDPAGDIYALGLILCYMVTGRKPRRRNYDHASYVEYANRAIEILTADAEEHVRLNALPAASMPATSIPTSSTSKSQAAIHQRLHQTVELINGALSKEPSQRPTAQAFADETARLLSLYGRPIPGAHALATAGTSFAVGTTSGNASHTGSVANGNTASHKGQPHGQETAGRNPKATGWGKWRRLAIAVATLTLGVFLGWQLQLFDRLGRGDFSLPSSAIMESGSGEGIGPSGALDESALANTASGMGPQADTNNADTTSAGAKSAAATDNRISAAQQNTLVREQPPTLAPSPETSESGASSSDKSGPAVEPSVVDFPPPTLVPLAEALAKTTNRYGEADGVAAGSASSSPTEGEELPLLVLSPEATITVQGVDNENHLGAVDVKLSAAVVVAETASADSPHSAVDPVVRFSWFLDDGVVLSDGHCFQLVVWHPEQPDQVLAPIPPTPATAIEVRLAMLEGYQQWGIRIVNCIQPEEILRKPTEENLIPVP